MKPYYEHCGITIYQADCMAIIPSLPRVHCVMTSPPYNTLAANHLRGGIHSERKSGINKWILKAETGYAEPWQGEDEYQNWLRGVLEMCMSKCDGILWVNHKIRYRDGEAVHPARFLPWPIYAEIIWNRGISMALNCKRFAPSHEAIWGFGKPCFWSDDLNTLMSVWTIPPQIEEEHPCPYPLEIPSRLIASSCPPDGIVLEPFSGIGTTLLAAKQLGRRAIGIEIEEKYCEIAAKRLSQEVFQFEENQ